MGKSDGSLRASFVWRNRNGSGFLSLLLTQLGVGSRQSLQDSWGRDRFGTAAQCLGGTSARFAGSRQQRYVVYFFSFFYFFWP
ncbi:hypothetical protein KFK09_026428 [Dendrobium nobile]|uniref:Uncharacterized protein n=1 Tax=Dendrobium nobile TaxID=94219 RepID=A0A8T3A8Q0_DENNO|nr:hypothetical protein KFK09_026428 [Dendrobium nobile]